MNTLMYKLIVHVAFTILLFTMFFFTNIRPRIEELIMTGTIPLKSTLNDKSVQKIKLINNTIFYIKLFTFNVLLIGIAIFMTKSRTNMPNLHIISQGVLCALVHLYTIVVLHKLLLNRNGNIFDSMFLNILSKKMI